MFVFSQTSKFACRLEAECDQLLTQKLILQPRIETNWIRKVGDTADLARSRGVDAKEYGIVAGLRVWY